MDLRAFSVLSLLVCLVAPAYDHHAAERDPWHGHLVRHGSQSTTLHRHSYEHQHQHAQAEGILITEGGPGAAPSVSVAGSSSQAPEPAAAPEGALHILFTPEVPRLDGLRLAGAHPPPRTSL